ncbi:hypothetical protein ALC60_01893 [Trachymyrmex zeteki]|uniref:Uncharacterized protein n=1 Tax=Mycetomoellerius zeteki TaxID=64791 RepID=A0A151XFL3_9HYME|nr:hypothetical protein ALC60_01893 [Trachymyrmex zeteki]
MCIVIDINDQSCTLLLLRHCKFYRSARFPTVPHYEDDTLTGATRMCIACIAVR